MVLTWMNVLLGWTTLQQIIPYHTHLKMVVWYPNLYITALLLTTKLSQFYMQKRIQGQDFQETSLWSLYHWESLTLISIASEKAYQSRPAFPQNIEATTHKLQSWAIWSPEISFFATNSKSSNNNHSLKHQLELGNFYFAIPRYLYSLSYHYPAQKNSPTSTIVEKGYFLFQSYAGQTN